LSIVVYVNGKIRADDAKERCEKSDDQNNNYFVVPLTYGDKNVR
jgi:hypothetical protein